ncbi:MAG: AAA family ATPase [Cyanobacteria bacterium P01_E01_bin.6]
MTLPASASLDSLPELNGYTLAEQLYLGSRTAVYRAVQHTQQHPVVIKVLQRDYPSFSELVQFRNQYTIAKNLPIPGIVQPLSLEPFGSGYALVMEDWGGIALGTYIQQRSLELSESLAIALQITDILHDLFQHRVVHKDIKPANILIHPESKQIKLIDFSIASLLPKETQEIQSPNRLEGTLAYLAPEQTGRMNRGIDYRADFYALGVTLYQLLTETLPFASDDPLELVHCHIAKMPIPVDQVNADVPVTIAAIVSKLMAKNAEDRYQSALGLKYDLEQCFTQWNTTGDISAFELGQRDVSDRFLIPEKLYGRDAEVAQLLAAFDRVSGRTLDDPTSELMLVAGFSGIGKTAVINEVHKPIVRQRGYFIKGKFDQFNRNIPFSAFVQAFRNLMGQVLSESDAQLAEWQSKILSAVGENGQVLIEVIPELEKIVGKQPIAPELSGSAAQKRFNLLFQTFIEVFTTAEHPLVLFLDDLQWADSASLQLIKLLMNDNRYLLLLGAYRDNEVSPTHPFILTVEELKKAQKIVNTITLAPLVFDDINHLIAATLNCSTDLAHPLSELIDRKTQGNPFFTTQFLKTLHEEEHIIFDHDRRHWTCDIAEVNTLALSDNVVEFMALQLQKLPPETQQVLKLAACIGNQFDLETLGIISEQSPKTAATALWRALQGGLILPNHQTYKFFQLDSTTQPNSNRLVKLTYRFLHDRVQQAAYNLIPTDQKQETHLMIGRLLLKNTTEADSNLFKIVNHWNIAIALITEPTERHQLAQLNWLAGCKAKASVAYEPGLEYFKTGLGLLDTDCWKTQYRLSLNLHEEAAKTAFICGDYLQMEQWAAVVFQQGKTVLDKVRMYDIQVQAQMAQAKPAVAIQIALKALKLLDIILPDAPVQADIENELQKTAELWNNRDISGLVDLSLMTVPEKKAAIIILSSIFAPSFIAKPDILPLIACQQIQLSIQFGNCEHSAFGYANYSAILSTLCNNLDASYQFGQLAIHLVDKLNAKEIKARTFNQAAIFSLHGKVHLNEAPLILERGCQSGIENGDLEFAGYAAYNWSQYSYFSGLNLNDLQQGAKTYSLLLSQVNQKISLSYNQLVQQVALNLLGESKNPCHLAGSAFDERKALESFLDNQVFSGIQYLFLHKIILSYLFENVEQLLEYVSWSERYLNASTGMIMVPAFHFYAALSRLQVYPQQSAHEKEQLLTQVQRDLAELREWAEQASMNFQHKFDLITAEQNRVLGGVYAAADFYDRAIAGAKEHGYIQEEALANERAAKFYLDWDKEKIAQDYLTKAYYCYARWGAKAKVQDLERRYPNLLVPIVRHQSISLSATETVFSAESSTVNQSPKAQSSTSGSTSISAAFDLSTVLKASQTLSSEIQLDKLLAILLHTVLENAGADKGALLMPRDDQWFVEAVATVDQPAQVESIALAQRSDIPHGLINSVKRSLQPAVIVDAVAHPTLATDVYVMQQQPRSLLCTPIIQQSKLVAILYLENRVTAGAFTRDRVELLNFLCAQAAISLENARLYSHVQDNQRQLFILLSNLPGMAYSCANDADWTMKFVSEGVFPLTGYRQEELIGNRSISYRMIICDDDVEIVETAVRNALRDQTHFQVSYRIHTKQGDEKWVWEQGRGVFDDVGTVLSIEGFIADISDRKAAESLIQEKNDALQHTLTQLQQSQAQVVQSEKMSALGNLVAGVAHEINNPIGFLHGNINHGKTYIQDLLKHLELYQQHYPNPVDEIQSHAEDIDLEFLNEDLPKILDSMTGATHRIRSISTSLRTFSRADTEHKVSANLHEGIDSTLLILKYRLKANEVRPAIQVIQNYGEIPSISCFPGQLNQVFMNILANAIDVLDEVAQKSSFDDLQANPQTITIQTLLKEQNTIEIRISDNGAGMPEDVKTRIFDYLFTTKGVGKGTGLGLAIAHQIVVEKHGGSLDVQSELGQGTEFCIRLPIHSE